MDIFDRNLIILETNRPELAARIKSLKPHPDRYRLIPTRGVIPSLEFVDENGKVHLFYSRYEPSRDVERDLASLDHSRIYTPMIAGIGLGYALRRLWDEHRHEFFDAVALEYDPQIFRLAMSVTRLDDIFSDPRLHIYLGPDLAHWTDFVRSRMSSIMSSHLQVLAHPPSQRCHPRFYETAYETTKQQIRLASAEFDLMIRYGPRIQENVWMNVPPALQALGITDVRGMLHGRPAIVVAAGPSLDKNVHRLKEIESSCAIIAVDTALRTLKKHGIDPHIVVTTDPTELNLKHFEHVDCSPDTILAFDPEVYGVIPNRWNGRRLFLNLEKTALTRWLEDKCGPFGFVEKGGSVGHTAFFLARELGADPIVFVGLDLAFREEGGGTHASASALVRHYGRIANGVASAELGPRDGSAAMREEIVWVRGVEGRPVPTSQVMALYIRQFCEEFKRTKAHIVDATEGGALLDGAEIMPLHQVMDERIDSAENVAELFRRLVIPQRDGCAIRGEMQRILTSLQTSIIKAKRGLELHDTFVTQISHGIALYEQADWLEMESCFSHLYQSADLKIALEQALFSAVYQFVQKERPDQVGIRLRKYQLFFDSFLALQPIFSTIIQRVFEQGR